MLQNFEISAYSDALKDASRKIDEIEKINGRECKCCKGCYGCCKQIIIISDFEKEILKDRINSFSFKNCKNIWINTKHIVERLIARDLTPETIHPYLSIDEQQDIQRKYFNTNIECPLLNNKSCLLYDFRPISCMTYRCYGDESPIDCYKTPFCNGSITYNNIEIQLWDVLSEKTNKKYGGFHILPFAIYEIMSQKRKLYDFMNFFS